MMSKSAGEFDPICIVVDWIDACRHRQLSALVELYDAAAVVDCFEGGRFRGRAEVERYWCPRLIGSGPSGFEIDALMPDAAGVSLDYRDHDGKPVRTHFRFSEHGKIIQTACAPIQRDGPDWAAA
jgi:ketosteroid isomerase-like protein